MSYSIEIARCLCDVFDKTSTLEAADLYGYRSNIGFWDSEFTHCLNVLKGYNARFQGMKNAIEEYQQTSGITYADGAGFVSEASMNPKKPLRRGVKNAELKDMMVRLPILYDRLLDRLQKEGLLGQAERNKLPSRSDGTAR